MTFFFFFGELSL